MPKRPLIGLLLALAALAALAPAARAQSDAPAESADRLYRVELIVFAYAGANRNEEDFFHGIEHEAIEPVPPLYRLPPLELETLAGDTPIRPGSADASTVAAPAAQDTGAAQNPNGIADADANTNGVANVNGNAEILVPGELPPDRLKRIEPFADAAASTAGTAPIAPFGTRRAAPPPAPPATLPAPEGFRVLPAEALELNDVASRLGRLPAYRVLGHAGWEQTGVEIERAVPLDLERLGITNPVGSIELYLGRFLHVNVDLEYRDGSGSFWTAPAGYALAPLGYATSYRLTTERNAIRRGELHYIDHPLFGILIRITLAPPPATDTPETGGRPAA